MYFSLCAIFLVVELTMLCAVVKSDDNAGELARIVNQLQSQVAALQESRSQDQVKIKNLQDKLQHHFSATSMDFEPTTEDTNDEAVDEPAFFSTSPPPITDVVVARVLTRKNGNLDLENDGDLSEINSDFELKENTRALRVLKRESDSLQRLDAQLRELKNDITEVVKVKEREITATEDIAEFRLEADSLRDELLRVKREVEEVRAKRIEEDIAVKHAKNGQVTTQWLQKTVEDLRREMTELASSVNISAALGQRQRDQTNLDLARYDINDLRKRLDVIHVAQERDSAWVTQMKQDIVELRKKIQDVAAGHQQLAHEVAEIKEELKEKAIITERQNHKIREETEGSHHSRRHHGHWKIEIEELQSQVKTLNQFQKTMRFLVRDLKDNQDNVNTKISTLEAFNNNLENRSSHLGVEQHAMFRQMETIQHQLEQQERQSNNLKSTVNNITETGIKKLHASTIHLFKTLENLEGNYDRTIEDIRKEMSKMEFSLAQTQSTLTELREEQTTYEHTIKSMKTEVKKVEMESKRNHYRLLSLKGDVINKTLQNTKVHHHDAMRQLRLSDLESKIASLTKAVDGERMEVDVLHKQIAEKADSSDLSRWERTQDRLRDIVHNISGSIPRMNKEEEHMQKEMQIFVKQLPRNCDDMREGETKHKSGAIIIQDPGSGTFAHSSPISVYCDMDTEDGGWLVIQRRADGRQNFNQNWIQYKEGFGDITGDFWLGNDLIHRLTTSGDYKLRIDLLDAAGHYKYVEYDTFRVLQESDAYRLAVGGYSGNGSDALGYHNGMSFSTPDRDNDASVATHCGQFYGSGWWYNHCQYVNINGRYSTGVTWYDINGQEWSELTKVEMKIKPLDKKLTKH